MSTAEKVQAVWEVFSVVVHNCYYCTDILQRTNRFVAWRILVEILVCDWDYKHQLHVCGETG
jgi:hypothetical protein